MDKVKLKVKCFKKLNGSEIMVEYRKSLSLLKRLTIYPKTGPISDPFQTPSDQMTPTNPPGCRNPQQTLKAIVLDLPVLVPSA